MRLPASGHSGRVLALIWLLAAAAHADDGEKPAPARDKPADQCAQATGSVRSEAYGYTHVLTLTNRCTKPVVCEVWTNVDPDPRHTLRVKPGDSEELVTRRGSPASEVTAEKSCRYE